MAHAFDALTPDALRGKACAKWRSYPEDVLPLWVADMDFPISPAIKEAIGAALEGENFGYPTSGGLPGLRAAVQRRLAERYNWRVSEDDIEPLSGIIAGLQLGCELATSRGEEVLMPTPIYPPFLSVVGSSHRAILHGDMARTSQGWQLDFERLEALVTPATRLLMFCNPHNPTGRVFSRDELEQLAEFVLRHRLWVVSDELHADLTLPGHFHLPLASLGDEIAQRTLTLYGPTKAFNIAGLRIGFAISQNQALLKRLRQRAGHLFTPNTLAQVATMAAYEEGDAWLREALAYLDGNRQHLAAFLRARLPQLDYAGTEGTYLAWLDFRRLELGERLHEVLLKECKLALNDGRTFGPAGKGFARLNFATSRGILEEALSRLTRGLAPYLD
jgi:cystathionine beta-lyase